MNKLRKIQNIKKEKSKKNYLRKIVTSNGQFRFKLLYYVSDKD